MYLIKSEDEHYIKQLNSKTDARHWIINHLDLSKQWDIHKLISEDDYDMIAEENRHMAEYLRDVIGLDAEQVTNIAMGVFTK